MEEVLDLTRINKNNNNSKNGSFQWKIAAIQAKIEAIWWEQIQLQTEMQLQWQQHAFWLGRMYAKLSDVWENEYCKVTDGAWENFWCTRMPDMLACSSASLESTAVDCPYIITKLASKDKAPVPIGITQSMFPKTNSGTSERKQNMWLCNFAGNMWKNWMGVKTATLVPPATEWGHEQWINIVATVLGLPPDASINIKLKGLRGSKIITKSQQKQHDNYNTGVVHVITNDNFWRGFKYQASTMFIVSFWVDDWLYAGLLAMVGWWDVRLDGLSGLCIPGWG